MFIKREHRCWNKREEDTCVDLFIVRNEDTPGDQIEYVDKNGKIYNTIFTFKEGASIEKRMADLFKRRVICEEKEFNRCELLTEECLKIHMLMYNIYQQFEEEHRPINHYCKKENKQVKSRTLIETNTLKKPKYRVENGNKYSK